MIALGPLFPITRGTRRPAARALLLAALLLGGTALPLAAKGPDDAGGSHSEAGQGEGKSDDSGKSGEHGKGAQEKGDSSDQGQDEGQGQDDADDKGNGAQQGKGDRGQNSGNGQGAQQDDSQSQDESDDTTAEPKSDEPQADGNGGQGKGTGNVGPGDEPPEDDTPVISPDDSGIGDMVLDGPSEPASAESSWGSLDSQSMSLAPPAADPAAAPPPAGAPVPTGKLIPPLSNATAPGVAPNAAAPAQPAGRTKSVPAVTASPVVVELFTSQGCSSCPPADALLGELTSRPDVLALTFHVDYWDYLGWVDDFARPEFTARQRAYGRRTGERATYTPQFVVGGLDTPLDLGPASLEMLVDMHEAEGSPAQVAVADEGERIRVDLTPGAKLSGAFSVDLVRFVPRREVRIGAGENRGRTVAYRNVVVSLDRLAVWDGRGPLRLTVVPRGGGREALPADTRHAVLVQQIAARRSLGQIIAAVPFD
ncbi:DUF1223 domain-containing protein [Paracoccus suum]|uniref:DUF1223 domain-containing protein n=1 Tax=Paracoccus suum TaxID=2259340 RepID=A0A344PG95_9RHOB|nr:DUF1223 domain-containing protein [Paracoccus suum]AXC48400.1 DUF1223 domain-containing protein [Paracoccus suum]